MEDSNLTNHLKTDWRIVHGIWEKIRAVVAVNVNLHNARTYSANDFTPTGDAWTTTLLDTESYDPNNNFTANAYTCPVAGKYLVLAGMYLRYNSSTADGTAMAAIYNNSTEVARVGRINAFYAHGDQYWQIAGGDVLNCTAGAVLTLKYYVTGSGGTDMTIKGGASHTYMAVHRVS